MSWQEQTDAGIRIITGDGKIYEPLIITHNLDAEVAYNYATYNFPSKMGSYVDRRLPIGKAFSLTVNFIGEDHIDTAKAFITSASNRSAWRVIHAIHGEIICQPLTIKLDNTYNNLSVYKIDLHETYLLTEKEAVVASEQVAKIKQTLNDSLISSTSSLNLVANDLGYVKSTLDATYANTKKGIVPKSLQTYYDYYRKAIVSVNSALNTSTALAYKYTDALQTMMKETQLFLDAPFSAITKVQARIDSLGSQYIQLRNSINGLSNTNLKTLWAYFAMNINMSMAQAILVNVDPTMTKTQYLNLVKYVLSQHGTLLADLDYISSSNLGGNDYYATDHKIMANYLDIMYYVFSHYNEVLSNAMTEVQYTVPFDTNIVVVSHKLLGLVDSDETIYNLINWSSLTLNEMMLIKKDRVLRYYL